MIHPKIFHRQKSPPWANVLLVFWWSQHITFSGQIIIIHQPGFSWNKGISLTKPPFGVRSCEVAIIWPDFLKHGWGVLEKNPHRTFFCPMFFLKLRIESGHELWEELFSLFSFWLLICWKVAIVKWYLLKWYFFFWGIPRIGLPKQWIIGPMNLLKSSDRYQPDKDMSGSRKQMSHEKNPVPYFPLNPGCLMGILIMVYFNPHISCVV